MSIVEERPSERVHAPAPGPLGTPAPSHPATATVPAPSPATAALPSDEASALAVAASIRITKGNPTAEEVATLAVLLAARIRVRQEARTAPPVPPVRKLARRPRPSFIAPGSWAS